MKHLKLFQTEAEYTAYKNGSDFITPNVSYAIDSIKIFYNRYVETRVVCTYNVTDTTNSTPLCVNPSNFTSIEVDGILLDSVTTGYTFDTVGEHTVKFELADTTSIGDSAFGGCSSLTTITIPNSVTSIGNSAFSNCSSLNEVICLATTAPSIHNYTFEGIKANGILKYPAGSDYSSWMSTDGHYFGYYNWTAQEI